ncbi:MAG: hypothetical protein JRJ35_12105 [Deltaproteobacteria bacterium]|nr:hypothetical protein [Deltaproteobacteria bacterium]MBW2007751.1 hypothetical protein [Deltaproteobacteria bacterium]
MEMIKKGKKRGSGAVKVKPGSQGVPGAVKVGGVKPFPGRAPAGQNMKNNLKGIKITEYKSADDVRTTVPTDTEDN